MQIQANGIFIEYEEYGAIEATPLILIRGLGTQLVHWPREFIAGFIEAGFRVIIFDNRGVGKSQRIQSKHATADAETILKRIKAGQDVPAFFELSDMAADVIGLMDALSIDKAHCFGISMGGAIMQVLATVHADRLLSATLVMSSCRPLFSTDAGASLISRILVYPETLKQYQDTHVASDALMGSPGYPTTEAALRAEATLAYARGADAEGINTQALAIIHASDRRDALRKVTLPCLVLHGVQDTLIPVELGAEIASNIPDSEFHAIEGMGHVITPLLSPVIVDIVTEFIAKRS